MAPPSAGLGRRLAAGGMDLYGVCYVALLPALVVGALALWRQGSMLQDEVGKARARPKGEWRVDPAREAELDKRRDDLFQKLFGDVGTQSTRFLNSLTERVLSGDQGFTKTLDELLQHPYTKLANQTVERAMAALKRFVGTSDGAKALADVQGALRTAAQQRVGDYVRAELDYRLGQIARYLGWDVLGKRLRAWMRGDGDGDGQKASAGPKGAGGVPAVLHFTQLIDRIAGGAPGIGTATAENLGLMRLALLLAAAFALAYLALRDVLGPDGSPGKRHAGLRIVDVRTGAPATAGQRALRGLVLVALLPLELVLALADRRLGDRVAHTRVVGRGEG